MIHLPNGARCTISVFPANWKTKAARTAVPWRITYRYYPADGKPVLRHIRGMNRIRNLEERQEATQVLFDNEIQLLRSGYNPISGEVVSSNPDLSGSVGLMDALRFAFDKLQVVHSTRVDIRHTLSGIGRVASIRGFATMPVSEIRKKHVKILLQECSQSAYRFNKNRSYLMVLFGELCEMEAIEINPVREIKKQKAVKRIRRTLTKQERTEIDKHLFLTNYHFWRYMQIFFHSGARSTELLSMQAIDVDLPGLRYKAIIKKGRSHIEKWRPIKKIVAHLWEEILNESGPYDYIFSRGLKPGAVCIQAYQITKRWKRLIKDRLGVQADFYSLKHSNLTEVSGILGAQAAASNAGHSSTAMVVSIYDVDHGARSMDQIRNVDNQF